MKTMSCAGAVLIASMTLAAGEAEKVRVTFYTPSIVRVVKTPDGRALPPKPVDVIVAKPMSGQPAAKDEGGCRVWRSDELTVRLDLKTGACLSANAGHEHPALRRKGGRFELDRYEHDPMLGLMPDLVKRLFGKGGIWEV